MNEPMVPGTAVPDDLVVHLRHLDVVRGWLRDNEIAETADADADERLGLALLKVDADVDAVLRDLRGHFERVSRGWVPLVGRNRHLGNDIVGMPQPKPHFFTDPEKVPAPTVTPPPEAGRGVRVGVVDTRIFDHPDLTGRFLADRATVWRPSEQPWTFLAGHATFVAGLVLEHAPAAELHVVDALDDGGIGNVWDFAKKLVALADRGLDVLNLSLGCHTLDNRAPMVLRRAIELISRRVLVVASAGNHGVPGEAATPTWPAALPDVVAVGATGEGYSPNAPWVTCTTAGTAISTFFLVEPDTEPKSVYAEWQGTSFAAASVTGAIAARTVPGRRSAREAFDDLLAEPNGVVAKYVQPS